MSESKLTRRSLIVSATAFGLAGASACEKVPDNCNDVSGLSPEERKVRATLGYVDRTPHPDKPCEKCQQWIPASPGRCGSCKVLAGPVHPGGYCRAFAPI